MTDIVKRLRDSTFWSELDMHEAADEIEQLRSENDRLVAALGGIVACIDVETARSLACEALEPSDD